jgi:DNA/RNA endonuclease YhcR with UshA esterase domain
MKRALAMAVLLPFLASAANGAVVSPVEAARHIGENATVCGTVASVHYAPQSHGQPTFLNLGHAYPNVDFTAVVWGEDRPKFGAPEDLEGQRICVTGPITGYRGKPEMVLRDASQLKK